MSHSRQEIAQIRTNYGMAGLSKKDLGDDPVEAFGTWFLDFIDKRSREEPNACTLATSGKDGKPSIRVILLKDFDAHGFIFYSNYQSKKGRQIQENPYAALNFFWHELGRQVRIEGKVEKIDRPTSEQYFLSRPKGSQLGAIASPQSQVIPDRQFLEKRYEELKKSHISYPENWGGYRLIPELIEFWQGRPNRLHDRIQFRLESGRWIKERLAP